MEPLLDQIGPQEGSLRLARGKKRLREHGDAARGSKASGTTFLEQNTVQQRTADRYRDTLDEFFVWRGSSRSLAGNRAKLENEIVEYMEHLYFNSHHSNMGNYLLAAIRFTDVGLNTDTLPRAYRAARGFRRLAPGLSRAPLPWVGLMAMVGCALQQGLREQAVMMWLHFVLYLRPSELLRLRAWQLVPPVRGA